MTLYQELKPFQDIIDLWTVSQSMTSTHADRIQQMFAIFNKHTNVDMLCKTCNPAKKLDRVVNWFNREKEIYRNRGAKRKKK